MIEQKNGQWIAPTVLPEIPKLVLLDLNTPEGKRLADQRKLLCFKIEFFAQQPNPEQRKIKEIKRMIEAIDSGVHGEALTYFDVL